MTEHDLDTRVLTQFNAVFSGRGFLYHTHAELVRDRQGRQLATMAGTPDLVGCLDGRFLAFEDKARPNRPTPAQWTYLRKVIDCGGYAGMFVLANNIVYFIPPRYIESTEVESFSWAHEQLWLPLGGAQFFSIFRAFPITEFPTKTITKEVK